MKRIEFEIVMKMFGIEAIPNEYTKSWSGIPEAVYGIGDYKFSYNESSASAYIVGFISHDFKRKINLNKHILIENKGIFFHDDMHFIKDRNDLIDFITEICMGYKCSLENEDLIKVKKNAMKNIVNKKLVTEILTNDEEKYNKMVEESEKNVHENSQLLKFYLDDFDKMINPFLDEKKSEDEIGYNYNITVNSYPGNEYEVQVINNNVIGALKDIIIEGQSEEVNKLILRYKRSQFHGKFASKYFKLRVEYEILLQFNNNEKIKICHIITEDDERLLITKLNELGLIENCLRYDLKLGEFSKEGPYDYDVMTDDDINVAIKYLDVALDYGKKVYKKEIVKTIKKSMNCV